MIRPRCVLVVEDEILLALDLADALASAGHEVGGPFTRLRPAWIWLERHVPDAALLDVNVGGELAEPVADLLAEHGVPFAFVTAYGTPPWQRHAERPRLAKPFTREQVRACVAALLGAR